eukprot:gnl/MRDRNA2_/MRDRNA2_130365_c0_seq1.p1 gnl/MRDRNA2_/MRDRNA2_130365_c0~~gnl/MRDRNA2_/MRDRNA2_130365_c0_seq1.p1  ORF type:complete len:506 (-),score=91.47 gnl/MRDRNA2_/MRDRNA2_130365_c0_seq1:218-1735(-)
MVMVQPMPDEVNNEQVTPGSPLKSLKGPDDGTESTASNSSEPNSTNTSPERDSSISSSTPGAKPKMPSIGSAPHASGQCSPCCFFPRGRCQNGQSCAFCHFEHEKRRHKKKSAGEGQKVQANPMEAPSGPTFQIAPTVAPPPLSSPPALPGISCVLPPSHVPQLPPWATASEHAAAQIVADAWRRGAYPPDIWPKMPAAAPPPMAPAANLEPALGFLNAEAASKNDRVAEALFAPPPGLERPAQSEEQPSKTDKLEDSSSDKHLEELFQELLKTELEKMTRVMKQQESCVPSTNAPASPLGLGLGSGNGVPPARYPAASPPPGGPPGLSHNPPGTFSQGAHPGAPLNHFPYGHPMQNFRHGMSPNSPPTAPPIMPPNLPQRIPLGGALGLQSMPPAGPPSMPPSAPPSVPPSGPPSLPPSMPPQYNSPTWDPPILPPSMSPSLPPNMPPSMSPTLPLRNAMPPAGPPKLDSPSHEAASKKKAPGKTTAGKKPASKGAAKAGPAKK